MVDGGNFILRSGGICDNVNTTNYGGVTVTGGILQNLTCSYADTGAVNISGSSASFTMSEGWYIQSDGTINK